MSDIDIAAAIKECLGSALDMPGKEKGKLVYFAMKTVTSRQARKVRTEVAAAVESSGLNVDIPAPTLKKAIWSYAYAPTARMGVKMRPGKGRNKDKGKIPIKNKKSKSGGEYLLPILMWAADGTKTRTTKKGYNRGRIVPGKFKISLDNEKHESEILEKLPKEVDRRYQRWISKQLKK